MSARSPTHIAVDHAIVVRIDELRMMTAEKGISSRTLRESLNTSRKLTRPPADLTRRVSEGFLVAIAAPE
eukprot:762476-Hanusia_phi.AAC.9